MAIPTCLVTDIYLVTHICPTKFIVVLVFVQPNSSYDRPKLKVIGQMSCHVKYLFAALCVLHYHVCMPITYIEIDARSPGRGY